MSSSSVADGSAAPLAAAGLGLSASQIRSRNDLFSAAVTAAEPQGAAAFMVASLGQNRPKRDLLPGHVDKARVSCILCHANDNTYIPLEYNRGHG
jgi:hypothetical protein